MLVFTRENPFPVQAIRNIFDQKNFREKQIKVENDTTKVSWLTKIMT